MFTAVIQQFVASGSSKIIFEILAKINYALSFAGLVPNFCHEFLIIVNN